MRQTIALVAGFSMLCVSSPVVAAAATLRCPLRGPALYTVELPEGWRSRSVGSSNEIRAESASRDVELAIEVSDASVEGRGIDDEVARRTDASFKKLEFSAG